MVMGSSNSLALTPLYLLANITLFSLSTNKIYAIICQVP